MLARSCRELTTRPIDGDRKISEVWKVAEDQKIGDYPATITPIGYVEVGDAIWNVASLLGCGGNVIVNVETLIDYLEQEEHLSSDEEKLLNLCRSAKEQNIGDLVLYE